MSKVNISFNIPFAVKSEPKINPINGYKYTKRITLEFKKLQEYARGKGLVFSQKDVPENDNNPSHLHYKNIFISLNMGFFTDFTELFNLISACFSTQTPSKHAFEE